MTHVMTIRETAANVVNVIDVRRGAIRRGTTTPVGIWVLHFDNAQRQGWYSQWSPSYQRELQTSGSRFDRYPHTPLTANQLQVGYSIFYYITCILF